MMLDKNRYKSDQEKKIGIFISQINNFCLSSTTVCVCLAIRPSMIGRLFLSNAVRTPGRTRCHQGAVAWRCHAGRTLGGLRRRTRRSGAELRTEHPSDRYSNGGVVRPSSVAPAYGRVTKWHCQRNDDPARRRTRSQRPCRVSPCGISDCPLAVSAFTVIAKARSSESSRG